MTNENEPNKPERGPTPPVPPNKYGRSLMGWVLIIALTLVFLALYSHNFDDRKKITFSEFKTHAQNQEFTGTVTVHEDRIEGSLKPGTPGVEGDKPLGVYCNYNPRVQENVGEDLDKWLAGSAQVEHARQSFWQGILPHLLITAVAIFLLWFLLFRRLGSAAGGGGFLGNFGRSKHRVLSKEHTQVTFDDIAGIEEAKEEVCELIEFLKNPRKFQRLGGRVPRGVLLVGEPGCGKTLLAKAIAGEAGAPFFSISGSDFVEMFVGVGASRVRDLFKQAKDSAPCIIFLDEIDAVGRRRGVSFSGGGHDEREQTLNAILVEMDGFDSSDQVIVIAATNRADVLDPALTRPGRFDRQIQVPLPDLAGRLAILKIYADKVKAGPDVDLERLARGTPMFSGADLEAVVNEAAIAATMEGKDFIEQVDLEEARDKVRWGRQRKSRVIDEQEKEITAYHEAGHAVVQLLTEYSDPLHKVSIIPRGPMGGATFSLPEKDRYLFTRRYCLDLLKVCLGGRIAEEQFCQDVTSGAQNDIAKATEIAKKMVLDWGMSERLGMVNYVNEESRIMPLDVHGKEYSEHTAEVVDEEIRSIIDEAYRQTREILQAHGDRVREVAKALIRYETLSAEEVQRIVEGGTIDKPTVGDLLEAEQAKAHARPDESTTPDAPPEPGIGPIPEPG